MDITTVDATFPPLFCIGLQLSSQRRLVVSSKSQLLRVSMRNAIGKLRKSEF